MKSKNKKHKVRPNMSPTSKHRASHRRLHVHREQFALHHHSFIWCIIIVLNTVSEMSEQCVRSGVRFIYMLSNTATDKMGPRVMTPLCTTGWLIMALFWSPCWIMPLQWVISFPPRSLRTPWFILALYHTQTLFHPSLYLRWFTLPPPFSLTSTFSFSPIFRLYSASHLFIHEDLILWMAISVSHLVPGAERSS